ncbi:hypothetical protein [Emticicia aquatilis]|nr:hypothetical protein [Emticicia aquatilis]
METQEKSSKTENKEKSKINTEYIKKLFEQRVQVYAILSLISGWLLIFIYLYFKKTGNDYFFLSFLHELGITLAAVGFVSVIYEFLLREHLLEVIENIILKIADKTASSSNNLRNAGLIDIYDELKAKELGEKISKLAGKDIIFLHIWIPHLDILKTPILEALRNKCNIKILVLSPSSEEAIIKRSTALGGYSPEIIKNEIIRNWSILETIKQEANKTNLKGSLQCLRHDNFIGISLVGYGDTFLMGHYLDNNLASNTYQFKICDASKPLFKILDEHFQSQWNRAEERRVEVKKEEMSKNMDFCDLF